MSCACLPSRSTRSRSTRPSSPARSSSRVKRFLTGLVILAAAGFAASASLLAHELGTIRVNAEFRKDGTYTIDAIIDREHLPPGYDRGGAIDPRYGTVGNLTPELWEKVGGLIAHAINGVEISLDGRDAAPRVEV